MEMNMDQLNMSLDLQTRYCRAREKYQYCEYRIGDADIYSMIIVKIANNKRPWSGTITSCEHHFIHKSFINFSKKDTYTTVRFVADNDVQSVVVVENTKC
jgi:hypothetical protein